MKLKLFLGALLLSASSMLMAYEQTGYITDYHLSSGFPTRGPCIKLNPAISGSGWACIWKDNALYEEYKELLLQAYSNTKSCKVMGNFDPNNIVNIAAIECFD